MKFNQRYEYKYLIDTWTYYKLKNYIKMYMKFDDYTNKSSKYLVRSLYFDNYNLESFHEKENGNWGRIKFRIRTYKVKVSKNDYLSFELKTKKGNIMEKYSKFISVQDYYDFMNNKLTILKDNLLLMEMKD